MSLECLLLTRDAVLLNDIRTHFSGLGIDLFLRKDANTVIETASHRHLDGFVIDCDDVPGGREVLHRIRTTNPANKLSMILAVVRPTTAVSEIFNMGADFALTKPVRGSRLRSILEVAVPQMEREHRRYCRHSMDLPATLTLHNGSVVRVATVNVSAGGMAVRVANDLPAEKEEVVTVEFAVRNEELFQFRAQALLIWKRDFLIGLRFLHMEGECRDKYEAWLDTLEAKLRFSAAVEGAREI